MNNKDTIYRQVALNALCDNCSRVQAICPHYPCSEYVKIEGLPSAEPELLTDKEQRIFLAAMGREEKVCKEVDAETTREPYEDSLVKTCHEIIRKVKGALWAT